MAWAFGLRARVKIRAREGIKLEKCLKVGISGRDNNTSRGVALEMCLVHTRDDLVIAESIF